MRPRAVKAKSLPEVPEISSSCPKTVDGEVRVFRWARDLRSPSNLTFADVSHHVEDRRVDPPVAAGKRGAKTRWSDAEVIGAIRAVLAATPFTKGIARSERGWPIGASPVRPAV